MTLQLLHSDFPIIWGKCYFLFYQCTNLRMMEAVAEKRKSWNGPILKLALWGQVILFLNEQWFIVINMFIVYHFCCSARIPPQRAEPGFEPMHRPKGRHTNNLAAPKTQQMKLYRRYFIVPCLLQNHNIVSHNGC